MLKLTLSALTFLLASVTAIGAEPETPDNPAASAPEQQPKATPKKTEYDKLPYPALLKMANGGNREAQFELGSRHNYGRDLPKNSTEALRWLRKAAQAGHTGAQRLLAVKLYGGHDVPVNLEEAFTWAQRLANSGDRPGQLMLGNLYANGEGTPRDLVHAYMWFDIASTPITGKELLPEAEQLALESAVKERDKTSSLLLPEQEAAAQQLASDWWLGKKAPAAPSKKASGGGRKKTRSKSAAS